MKTRKAVKELYGHIERLTEIVDVQSKVLQKHSALLKELIGEEKYPIEEKRHKNDKKIIDKAYR